MNALVAIAPPVPLELLVAPPAPPVAPPVPPSAPPTLLLELAVLLPTLPSPPLPVSPLVLPAPLLVSPVAELLPPLPVLLSEGSEPHATIRQPTKAQAPRTPTGSGIVARSSNKSRRPVAI